MFRTKKFYAWKKHRRPREGQTPARRTVCLSGHWHGSGFEAIVCGELRLRKIAKDIVDYKSQVPITLMDGNVNVSKYIGKYIADFVIEHTDGTTEIVDAKGIVFPTFKKKWAALEQMFKGDPMIKLTIVRER